MTRTTRTLLLAALVVLAGWAMGAQDQGIKIGVVDIDQALNSTDEGKAAREELARKKREADQELQPMIERFGTMREEIDGKKYVLSDQALFTKQLVEIITRTGRDQGFTLILRRDAPGVMYTREALDITEEVISRFNKKRS